MYQDPLGENRRVGLISLIVFVDQYGVLIGCRIRSDHQAPTAGNNFASFATLLVVPAVFRARMLQVNLESVQRSFAAYCGVKEKPNEIRSRESYHEVELDCLLKNDQLRGRMETMRRRQKRSSLQKGRYSQLRIKGNSHRERASWR